MAGPESVVLALQRWGRKGVWCRPGALSPRSSGGSQEGGRFPAGLGKGLRLPSCLGSSSRVPGRRLAGRTGGLPEGCRPPPRGEILIGVTDPLGRVPHCPSTLLGSPPGFITQKGKDANSHSHFGRFAARLARGGWSVALLAVTLDVLSGHFPVCEHGLPSTGVHSRGPTSTLRGRGSALNALSLG